MDSDEPEVGLGALERLGAIQEELRGGSAAAPGAIVGALGAMVALLEEFEAGGELPAALGERALEGALLVLDALRGPAGDNGEVATEAACALYAYTERAGLAARVLVEQGALPVLRALIGGGGGARAPGRARLYAVRVVHNLAKAGGCHAEVAGDGALVAAVVAATREGQDGDEQLAMNGVGALAAITAPEGAHRAAAAGAGALDVALDAMDAHPGCAVVQTCGCGVVGALIAHEPGYAQRALPLVVSALRIHAGVDGIQSSGYAALMEVVRDSATWSDVAALDVVSLLTGALVEPAATETALCAAMGCLVSLVQSAGDVALALLGTPAVLHAVAAAMRSRPLASYIAWGGCTLLYELTEDADLARTAQLLGSVRLALGALERHGEDNAVADAALAALSNVPDWDAGVAAEALKSVVRAMVVHAERAVVQVRACTVLYRVTEMVPTGYSGELVGALLRAVVAAMGAHAAVGDVPLYASRALANIAVDEDVVRAVLGTAAVALTVEAMGQHVGSPVNQWNGAALLYRVTSHAALGSCAAVVAAGGVQAMLAAMAAHEDEPTLQWASCATLANLLAADGAGCGQTIATPAVIVTIVRALREHAGSVQVQEHALSLLCGIATNLAGRQACDAVSDEALECAALTLESNDMRAVEVVRDAAVTFLHTVAAASAPAVQLLRSRAALVSALEHLGAPPDAAVLWALLTSSR